MKVLICVLLCIFLIPTFAFAQSVPAYVFYFSNLGEGGTGRITRELSDMGYDVILKKDEDAKSIISVMDDAAVFSYVGHGKAGRLYCKGDSEISAVGDEENVFSLSRTFGENGLDDLRLVYYGSCFSDTQSPIYGQLTSKTAELGADAVIGFDGAVNDTVATFFEEVLFDNMQQGASVGVAVDLAKAECQANDKNKYEYSNVDTAMVYGNGKTMLIPAGFGR